MRNLSPHEVLTLSGVLKMEKDGLALARATQELIADEQLKKQADAGILAAEGRIKGLQQFVTENQLLSIEEVM